MLFSLVGVDIVKEDISGQMIFCVADDCLAANCRRREARVGVEGQSESEALSLVTLQKLHKDNAPESTPSYRQRDRLIVLNRVGGGRLYVNLLRRTGACVWGRGCSRRGDLGRALMQDVSLINANLLVTTTNQQKATSTRWAEMRNILEPMLHG
jgi:hypothetical protein